MLIYLLVICNEDLNIIDILLCQDKHIVSNFQVFQSTSISRGREGGRDGGGRGREHLLIRSLLSVLGKTLWYWGLIKSDSETENAARNRGLWTVSFIHLMIVTPRLWWMEDSLNAGIIQISTSRRLATRFNTTSSPYSVGISIFLPQFLHTPSHGIIWQGKHSSFQ